VWRKLIFCQALSTVSVVKHLCDDNDTRPFCGLCDSLLYSSHRDAQARLLTDMHLPKEKTMRSDLPSFGHDTMAKSLMSRSRRSQPILGNTMTKSEKDDKQRAAMVARKRIPATTSILAYQMPQASAVHYITRFRR
jgi:hypothetical protein